MLGLFIQTADQQGQRCRDTIHCACRSYQFYRWNLSSLTCQSNTVQMWLNCFQSQATPQRSAVAGSRGPHQQPMDDGLPGLCLVAHGDCRLHSDQSITAQLWVCSPCTCSLKGLSLGLALSGGWPSSVPGKENITYYKPLEMAWWLLGYGWELEKLHSNIWEQRMQNQNILNIWKVGQKFRTNWTAFQKLFHYFFLCITCVVFSNTVLLLSEITQ